MLVNERLQQVASFIKDGSQVLDVGCDHALLDIFLVKTKKNIRAVASDVYEKPLEQAKKNILKCHLEDTIEVRLGNGIDTIDSDIDTVVISGMGGLKIIGILKYQTAKLENVKHLVLSPNNDFYNLRKEIVKLGFFIENEILLEDKRFFYPIILFTRGKKSYRKEELIYGPILLEKKDKNLLSYIEREKKIKEKLLEVLSKKYIKRRFKLKLELKEINKFL